MPYKTWTAGEVLQATDLMDYLMRQAVPRLATTTEYPTPALGALMIRTGDLAVLQYTATGWHRVGGSDQAQETQPVLTHSSTGGTITYGNSGAQRWTRSHQTGRRVQGAGNITLGSGAVISGITGALRLRLPAPPLRSQVVGTVLVVKQSTNASHVGVLQALATDPDVYMRFDGTSGAANGTVPLTWTEGDSISYLFDYERTTP